MILCAVLALGLGGAGQPAPKRLIEFSDAPTARICDRISAYLNSIRTLQGEFVQIGSGGRRSIRARSISRNPGACASSICRRIRRWSSSDGHTVAVANKKLKTVDRYPLSSTPLDLILRDKIDLLHNDAIVIGAA